RTTVVDPPPALVEPRPGDETEIDAGVDRILALSALDGGAVFDLLGDDREVAISRQLADEEVPDARLAAALRIAGEGGDENLGAGHDASRLPRKFRAANSHADNTASAARAGVKAATMRRDSSTICWTREQSIA